MKLALLQSSFFGSFTTAFLALGVVGLVGCAPSQGADIEEQAAASSEDALVDQLSSDTTVLKVQVNEALNGYGSPGFTQSDCDPIPNNTTGRMSCTRALEQRFNLPALHDVDLSMDQGSQFFCRVLHVVTVSKRAAVQASTGIGFYYRGYTGNGRFIAKNKLKKIGDATMKDGSPADLHEFIGLANCWLGSATSSSQARYEFKPYIAFADGANGESFHNWDSASGNHSVTTRFFVWDRSGELLQ